MEGFGGSVSRIIRRTSHRDTANTLRAMGQLLRLKGRLAEAEDRLRESLAMRRKLFGNEHHYVDDALGELTLTLLAGKKWADAEAPARESLAFREKHIPDDWLAYDARAQLGRSLFGQKKYADAEPLLISGHEGMMARVDKIPDYAKGRIGGPLRWLAQLCQATGRPAQAADHVHGDRSGDVGVQRQLRNHLPRGHSRTTRLHKQRYRDRRGGEL